MSSHSNFYLLPNQPCQWSKYFGKIFHKSPVISSHTQKTTYLSYIGGSRPVRHCFYLLRIHLNTLLAYHMPQETHTVKPKLTFRQFCIQLMCSKGLQYNPEMFPMFHMTFRINQDIIYKHHHKFIQIWFENPVHQIHKRGWCVSQPKRLYQELIMTIPSPECSLRYITLLHSQLMIPRPQVYLGVYSRSLELIK